MKGTFASRLMRAARSSGGHVRKRTTAGAHARGKRTAVKNDASTDGSAHRRYPTLSVAASGRGPVAGPLAAGRAECVGSSAVAINDSVSAD